jgi:hypothetical protein
VGEQRSPPGRRPGRSGRSPPPTDAEAEPGNSTHQPQHREHHAQQTRVPPTTGPPRLHAEWARTRQFGNSHHSQATIAVARKLAERTWTVLTRGARYQLRDPDGRPITAHAAKALIHEKFTVPEDIRERAPRADRRDSPQQTNPLKDARLCRPTGEHSAHPPPSPVEPDRHAAFPQQRPSLPARRRGQRGAPAGPHGCRLPRSAPPSAGPTNSAQARTRDVGIRRRRGPGGPRGSMAQPGRDARARPNANGPTWRAGRVRRARQMHRDPGRTGLLLTNYLA